MIRNYIIRRLASQEFVSEVVPLKQAKSLLILFGDLKGKQVEEALSLEKELLKIVPTLIIDICGVIKTKQVEEFTEKHKHILFFSSKNFGYLLKPKKTDERFRKLQVQKYDIVIDLSAPKNVFVKRLLFYVDKKLRVGRNIPENLPFYDLLISDGAKPDEFAKNAVHYLNLLNLPDNKS